MNSAFRNRFLSVLSLCAVIAALVLAASAGTPAAFGSEPDSASGGESATLTIGVPTDRCPISYIDAETGQITGIGVELARAAANNAGYDARFVALDAGENLQQALDDGRFDIVMPFGSAIASESGQRSIITESALDMPFTVVCVRGRQVASLETSKLGIIESSAGIAKTLRERYPGCTVELYPTWDDAIASLRAGHIDGLIYNTYVWSYLLQKPDRSDLEIIPINAVTVPFCLGTVDTPDHEQIIANLNAGIERLTDAQKQSVVLSYTSRNLYTDTLADTVYRYRPIIAAAAITIAIIIVGLILYIRQRSRYIKRLEAANVQLERANHAESEFLSNMSHDMRTPLNAVIGFSDLALATSDADRRQDYLEKIDSSGKLMLDLINDVLDLSKIESGTLAIREEDVDSRALFDTIIDSVSIMADEYGIAFSSYYDEKIPQFVRIDALHVQQAVLNLLTNAIKYTPKGGSVEFEIDYVPADAAGRNIKIRIADTGIGMSKEFQTRMFKPFTQEHQSSEYNKPGTGLGLSIAKRIVDELGGTIAVESALGRGTTFTVMLAVEVVDAAPEEHDENLEEVRAIRGKRILICEDNDLNAEVATTILEERAGAIIERAENGRIGFDLFKQSPFGHYDAVLMDLRMPNMNGFEATRAIRALDRADAHAVPIIAMTADAFDEDIDECIDAGMDGHVGKPVDPDVLIAELGRHIV